MLDYILSFTRPAVVVTQHPVESHFAHLSRYHFFLYFFLFTAKVPMFWQVLSLLFLSPPMTYICNDTGVKDGCPCKNITWNRDVFKKTLQTKYDLICDRKFYNGLCHSLLYVGSLLGSFIFGTISDKFGRLNAFVISITTMGIFGIVIAFMPIIYAYFVIRVLQGLGIGGSIVTGYVLCVEFCGAKQRELISALYHIPLNIGHLSLPGLSYLLKDCDHFQIAVSAPILLFVVLKCLCYESPKWLCDSGRIDRAVKTMEGIAKFNKTSYGDVKAEMEAYLAGRQIAEKEQFWHIFRYRRLTINFFALTFIFFGCSVGYYGVSQYIGQMSGNVHLNVFISGSVLIPATLLTILLFYVLSRKAFLVLTSFVSGILLLVCVFTPKKFNIIKVILASIGNCAFWMSFIIVFLYAVELFPTSVRNSTLGFLAVCARLGQIVAPFINELPQYVSGIFFGASAIIGGFLVLLLPETKGKELPSRLVDMTRN